MLKIIYGQTLSRQNKSAILNALMPSSNILVISSNQVTPSLGTVEMFQKKRVVNLKD